MVVRGVLASREGDLEIRGSTYESWLVEVKSPILAPSGVPKSLKLARLVWSVHTGPEPVYREWNEGSEGVFFLTPNVIGWGAPTEVYGISLGGLGVVWEDLDRWEEVIPMGGHLLAARNSVGATLEARLATAEVAVVGVVQGQTGGVSTFAGEYAVLEVAVSEVLWPPAENADGIDVGSLAKVKVWVPVDSVGLYTSDAPQVFLLTGTYGDPCCFAVVGGADGVLPAAETESVKAGITAAKGPEALQANDEFKVWLQQEAVRLASIYGPIPLDLPEGFLPEEPQIDRSAILSELIRQPLEVVVGDVRVVFDQWFFSTFDPAARVMVVDAEGLVLADGLVSGPDAILVQEEGFGWVIVGSDGGEVVRFTHAQLHEAADAAARAAGVID